MEFNNDNRPDNEQAPPAGQTRIPPAVPAEQYPMRSQPPPRPKVENLNLAPLTFSVISLVLIVFLLAYANPFLAGMGVAGNNWVMHFLRVTCCLGALSTGIIGLIEGVRAVREKPCPRSTTSFWFGLIATCFSGLFSLTMLFGYMA